MLDQDVISPYYHRRSVKCTHCLVLHAGEYHIQHLREGGFGRGLVDEVLTGQVDVVARSHGLQHRTFMDLYLLGGHGCKQGLSGAKQTNKQTQMSPQRRLSHDCSCVILGMYPDDMGSVIIYYYFSCRNLGKVQTD